MYESTLATEIKVGDIINVNTGYRPLDDEDCEVLEIKNDKDAFGYDCILFYIKSYWGNHWYQVYLEQRYGFKVYQTTLTKLVR